MWINRGRAGNGVSTLPEKTWRTSDICIYIYIHRLGAQLIQWQNRAVSCECTAKHRSSSANSSWTFLCLAGLRRTHSPNTLRQWHFPQAMLRRESASTKARVVGRQKGQADSTCLCLAARKLDMAWQAMDHRPMIQDEATEKSISEFSKDPGMPWMIKINLSESRILRAKGDFWRHSSGHKSTPQKNIASSRKQFTKYHQIYFSLE